MHIIICSAIILECYVYVDIDEVTPYNYLLIINGFAEQILMVK